MRSTRSPTLPLSPFAVLVLLLALPVAPGCPPALGDDDDATADDDDATGDDDDATGDDDDATGDDDDATGDDDDVVGDDDDVAGACGEEIEPLYPEQESAFGYSGADVVAPIAGPLSAPATWSSSSDATTITFSLEIDGDPLFHDLSPPAEPPPWGPEPACADWLEIPVVVYFSTPDGVFDEAFRSFLYQQQDGGPSFSAPLDWAGLGGTFDLNTVINPAEWDTVGMDVWGSWDGSVMTGQIAMNASRQNPNGVGEGMVGPILLW